MAGRKDENGLTPRREAFCRAYVETGNASEAYRRSFSTSGMKPETLTKRASEMMARGEVWGRIEELRASAAQRHEITVDSLSEMLREDRKLARELGQPAAAVSAVKELGRLHGLGVDKRELSVQGSIAGMNDAELDRFIADIDNSETDSVSDE